MTKAKHTPGPWNWDNDGAVRAVLNKKGDETTIAEIRGWLPEYKDEEVANARLIAAAPELLTALKFAVQFNLPMNCASYEKARAAIAKAEGK